jgi:hypothetical protein
MLGGVYRSVSILTSIDIIGTVGHDIPTDEGDHPMDLVTELLASTREADVRRMARSRRMESLIETCRRRLFRVLPISQPCGPC